MIRLRQSKSPNCRWKFTVEKIVRLAKPVTHHSDSEDRKLELLSFDTYTTQ